MTEVTPRNRGALTVIEPVIERPAAKAQRLMLEARTAAREQVADTLDACDAAFTGLMEVAHGDQAYAPGIRAEAERVCERWAKDIERLRGLPK